MTKPYQERVATWLKTCFGKEVATDRHERNHRFLEETLELVQACGCTAYAAHKLVDYVFTRPVGEKGQEVGGVAVTFAALCWAQDIEQELEAEKELSRIWTCIDKVRTKQATKPSCSPLPGIVLNDESMDVLNAIEQGEHIDGCLEICALSRLRAYGLIFHSDDSLATVVYKCTEAGKAVVAEEYRRLVNEAMETTQ